MTEISIYSDLAGAPHIKPAGPVPDGFSGEQGDLVGLTANGELAHATADSSGPVPMRGCLFPDHVTDLDTNEAAQAVRAVELYKGSNDTLAGEHRASMVSHGYIIQNDDEDWGFSCDQPVYLSESGGLTQTKPSTSGAIVQAVGFPVNLDRLPAGEAVWIDVDTDYETVV